MSRSDYDALKDEVAKLRDAFLSAVPAALDDHRFGEMIGSPWSVLQYVTEYFNEQAPTVPQEREGFSNLKRIGMVLNGTNGGES